ncbi:hypothetical protein FJZ26_01205, partial [Candidatus Parvarchaeota archaeon]|nr:hypothetical protein [Candidatus Parvarchaeota archaeon]
MLIFAVCLVAFTAFLALGNYYFGSLNLQKEVEDAQSSTRELAGASDWVYSQGLGAKRLVYITIPPGIDNNNRWVGKPPSNATDNTSSTEINIRVYNTDVFSTTRAPVRGSLPTSPGGYWVWVESFGDFVLVGT